MKLGTGVVVALVLAVGFMQYRIDERKAEFREVCLQRGVPVTLSEGSLVCIKDAEIIVTYDTYLLRKQLND